MRSEAPIRPDGPVAANLGLTAVVVTEVDAALHPVLRERSLDSLLEGLYRRAERLVSDRRRRFDLRGSLREFVHHVVEFFRRGHMLDHYTLTNLATALVCADSHGHSNTGPQDYSTLIRRLNPANPQTNSFFLIGREGKVGDSACPFSSGIQDWDTLRRLPAAQLHMYFAFYFARSMAPSRGAPRIPFDAFHALIPSAITRDSRLEQAFLDVCFSDGAWELYQRTMPEIRHVGFCLA